ncbi:MAG TPA: hypothetical protein VFT64_11135 [Rickettsiales bacterium]|nr:hypothetical protein [Rickettsiales bacterium]
MPVFPETAQENKKKAPVYAGSIDMAQGDARPISRYDNTNKAWIYLKSRFDKEHRFDSFSMLACIYAYYQNARSALVRQVHGVREVDKLRVTSSLMAMGEKSWAFWAGRGAQIPEGNTVFQRVGNVLRHPSRSSSQFEYLAILPAQALTVYNNTRKGLKAHGIGLAEGERAYPEERIRLYSALVTVGMKAFYGYGHFKERPQEIASEHEIDSKGKMKLALKYERELIIGGILDVISPLLNGIEGWKKSGKSKEEAKHILSSAAIGMAISGAYGISVFRRVFRSNYKITDQSTPDMAEQIPAQEQAGPLREEVPQSRKFSSLAKQQEPKDMFSHRSESFVQRYQDALSTLSSASIAQ